MTILDTFITFLYHGSNTATEAGTMIKLIHIWNNWYTQDCLVIIGLLAFLFMIFKFSQREYWQLAYREVKQRKLAVICFFILSAYSFIAIIDSIGWYHYKRDANNQIVCNKVNNKPLRHANGRSILDLILTKMANNSEESYSAPLAEQRFTPKFTVDKTGKKIKIHPLLKYPKSHVLGTDKVGKDVLLKSIKGIRTAMIIGLITTIVVIPFGILFGVLGGYFGGWIDDSIQYVYTVLSSIPSVLLMISFMMIFGSGLLQLCIAMSITSWTNICRVLRGETMRLREAEFIQAAEAMGVSSWQIMLRHITPNIMPIILITAILRFSGLVLAEASLTYLGIGVGAETASWGAMINATRLELARDPIIWWQLAASFTFMLGLILPANIFGDALRDALDPKLRTQ